jgi:hypothetical protein
MYFDENIFTIIKSYLIDYNKIEIKRRFKQYNDIGRLSESYCRCYCERFIRLSKYSNHLRSKSHQMLNHNVMKKNILIDTPSIVYFDIVEK